MKLMLRGPASRTLLVVSALGSVLILGQASGAPAASPRPPSRSIPHGGESVIAYGSMAKDGHGEVHTIRADGTDRRRIARGFDPVWSPDGSMIAYNDFPFGDPTPTPGDGGWNLMIADAQGTRMLVGGIGCYSTGLGPRWSPDGRFVLYPDDRGAADCGGQTEPTWDLMVVPADGSAPPRQLLATSPSSSVAEWSPSGDRVTFLADDEDGSGLWIADVTDPSAPFGLQAHRLSKPGAYPAGSWGAPAWSPDGTRIATSRAAAGSDAFETVVMAADGSSETVLWPGPEDDANPSWSPDGTRLAMIRHAGPGGSDTDPYQLYLIDPDGSDPTLIDAPPVTGWAQPFPFSPDGTMILGYAPYTTTGTEDSPYRYVITLDGSAEVLEIYAPGQSKATWQPVVNPESPLAWAPTDASFIAPASPTP